MMLFNPFSVSTFSTILIKSERLIELLLLLSLGGELKSSLSSVLIFTLRTVIVS